MNIRLIAFDLDGTLLKNDKSISKRTLDVLHRAAEKGILLVPTTGRFFMGIPETVRDLTFVRYAICLNGAEVYDRENDQILYSAGLNKEDATMLWDYIDHLPGLCSVYQSGKGMMSDYDYHHIQDCDMPEALQSAIRHMYIPVEDIRKHVFSTPNPVQKIQAYLYTEEQKDREIERMKSVFPQFAITSSIAVNIEVNAPNATKGIALEVLSRHLNIPLEACMAIGDGLNDISMIEKAGIGVAMGNAVEEVTRAADVITATNENDGMAEIIEKYL